MITTNTRLAACSLWFASLLLTAGCPSNACPSGQVAVEGTCIVPGSKTVCESCSTDSECKPDYRCVPMKYQGVERPAGYCLKKLVGSVCERPFTTLSDVPSLSGAAMEGYCGPYYEETTCEAVLAMMNGKECPGGTDAECGALGALCRTVNGSAVKRCTYTCADRDHCPAGIDCGKHDWYCGGQ